MRTTSFFAFILLSASMALAQTDVFPVLKGETGMTRQITLPKDAQGKFTVLCLAYDKRAGEQLATWYEPAYLRFVSKHGLFAGTYDVNLWFVPMFTGLDKTAYGPTLKEVRKSEAPEVLDHILFFKGDIDLYVTELSMTDRSQPYLFVLDAEGRIVHRTSGAYTDDKLDAIEELLIQ